MFNFDCGSLGTRLCIQTTRIYSCDAADTRVLRRIALHVAAEQLEYKVHDGRVYIHVGSHLHSSSDIYETLVSKHARGECLEIC